jgi:hypothetical protein
MGCICDGCILMGYRLLRAFGFFANPAPNSRLAGCNNLIGDHGAILHLLSPDKSMRSSSVTTFRSVARRGLRRDFFTFGKRLDQEAA